MIWRTFHLPFSNSRHLHLAEDTCEKKDNAKQKVTQKVKTVKHKFCIRQTRSQQLLQTSFERTEVIKKPQN